MACDHNLAFTLIFAVLEFSSIKSLSFLLDQKLLFRYILIYKFELLFDGLCSLWAKCLSGNPPNFVFLLCASSSVVAIWKINSLSLTMKHDSVVKRTRNISLERVKLETLAWSRKKRTNFNITY